LPRGVEKVSLRGLIMDDGVGRRVGRLDGRVDGGGGAEEEEGRIAEAAKREGKGQRVQKKAEVTPTQSAMLCCVDADCM